MKEPKKGKRTPFVWVTIILLAAFWIGFALGIFYLIEGLAGEIGRVFFAKSVRFKASMLDVNIELLVMKVVLFWVLFHLQKIMLTITRGETFDSRNPGWIRKVAWGTFAFAVFRLVSGFYWSGLPELKFISLYGLIKGEAFRMALFGLSILIIGRAFETGLMIRKDQELTI